MTKNKNDSGYIVLPIAYAKGMKAKAGNQSITVKQANGIMTAIPAKAGQSTIRLTYTATFYLLIILSIIGILLSIILLE